MFWLAPDTVPTMGDWFRAGGYRTYFKGKWHASHAHLQAEDGDGPLLSIDDDGNTEPENIQKYLQADLLDEYGFSEWSDPSRTDSARTTPEPSRTPSPLMRPSRCCSALMARTATSRG